MFGKDYLVTWRPLGPTSWRMAVVRIMYPPHDEPRGASLLARLRGALLEHHGATAEISAAVELESAVWSPGIERELVCGDGRAGTLRCEVPSQTSPGGCRVEL